VAHLLLADDERGELERLEQILVKDGHVCTPARDGAEALQRFSAKRPDLVILDVMMPGMDGIKATRKLKQKSAGAYLPILLVTGLSDVEDRLAGFEAGADDFLIKPVEDWEVRARVRTFLEIAAQQRATERALARVRELQSFRDELVELLVHDLKSPLACLSANLTFVESRLGGDHEGREAVADCRDSTGRLLRMVTVLLDINRLEERRLSPTVKLEPALGLLEHSARGRAHEAAGRAIRLEIQGDPARAVRLDADLMGRVIDNLLDNALRFTPRGGLIALWCERGPLCARIGVGISGPAIAARDRGRIFAKYERAAGPGHGTANRGLGLYFCRLAVEAHGGGISVGDDPRFGACFHIDLPS